MELRTSRWEVRPLGLAHLSSSFFDDPSLFPEGSIHFDHVLSMRNLEHEWHEAKRPSL
ncbi:hypothetical protein [Deinococcus cellulosilyticus]|nr:hypothetical protein [Deinococcus cellulosilyticus]